MELDIPSLFELLPNTQYREWMEILFPLAGGKPINSVILVLNLALVTIAAGYALLQLAYYPFAMLRTKQTGAGKGISWGTMRAVFAFFLLVPSPTNGLSMMNQAGILFGSAANNLAQLAWNRVKDDFFDVEGPIDHTILPDIDTVAAKYFEMYVCSFYTHMSAGRGVNGVIQTAEVLPEGMFDSVDFDGAPSAFGLTPKRGYCGNVSFPDLEQYAAEEYEWLQGDVAAYQLRLAETFVDFGRAISPIALDFAAKQLPTIANAGNAPSVSWEAFERAKEDYLEKRQDVYSDFIKALRRAKATEYFSEWSTSWLHAGSYWQRIANLGYFQSNITLNSIPLLRQPVWDKMYPTPPQHILSMRSRLSEALAIGDIDLVPSYKAPSAGANKPSSNGFLADQIMKMLRNKIAEWVTQFPPWQDPMKSLAARGYVYLGIYGGIYILALSTVLFSGPIGPALVLNVTETFRGFMLFAGLLLALVLPIIPFIFFTIGIIAWLIPLILFIVTAPLTLIANIRFDSSFIIQGNAWVSLIEIFLRPIVLIAALGISYGLFAVIASLLDATMGAAIAMSYNSFEGLVIFAGMAVLYSILMGFVAIGCLQLFHVFLHLTDRL